MHSIKERLDQSKVKSEQVVPEAAKYLLVER